MIEERTPKPKRPKTYKKREVSVVSTVPTISVEEIGVTRHVGSSTRKLNLRKVKGEPRKRIGLQLRRHPSPTLGRWLPRLASKPSGSDRYGTSPSLHLSSIIFEDLSNVASDVLLGNAACCTLRKTN